MISHPAYTVEPWAVRETELDLIVLDQAGSVFALAVLPVLTYTASYAVRDALRWRHATIGLARDRAKLLGFEGETFPWPSTG